MAKPSKPLHLDDRQTESPRDTASAEAQAAGLPPGAAPVTPMAPVTQPAPAMHEDKPTGIGTDADAVDGLGAFTTEFDPSPSVAGPMQQDAMGSKTFGRDSFRLPQPGIAGALDPARDGVHRAAPVGIVGSDEPMPVGAQPPAHGLHRTPTLDRLAHHPDGVIRARAAEAIAARNRGGADAGILARAAIDTAAELDRSAGRIAGHTTRDGAFG